MCFLGINNKNIVLQTANFMLSAFFYSFLLTNAINNDIIDNTVIDNIIIDLKGESMAVKDHSLDEKIIKAAMDEFRENDFLKASLNKIAEKAGLTTGAVYTRYKSKDELFCSLVYPLLEEMQRRFSPLEKAYNDVRDSEDIGDILKVIRIERQIYVDILFTYYDECVLLFCRSTGSSVEAQLNKWTNQKAVSTAEFIRQRAKKEIDTDLIELIMNEQFQFYRQVLQKGFDKEKTVRLMDSVEEFHESGWKGLFEKI